MPLVVIKRLSNHSKVKGSSLVVLLKGIPLVHYFRRIFSSRRRNRLIARRSLLIQLEKDKD